MTAAQCVVICLKVDDGGRGVVNHAARILLATERDAKDKVGVRERERERELV